MRVAFINFVLLVLVFIMLADDVSLLKVILWTLEYIHSWTD